MIECDEKVLGPFTISISLEVGAGRGGDCYFWSVKTFLDDQQIDEEIYTKQEDAWKAREKILKIVEPVISYYRFKKEKLVFFIATVVSLFTTFYFILIILDKYFKN